MNRFLVLTALLTVPTLIQAAPLPTPTPGKAGDLVERALIEGRLAEGERELTRFVDANPKDAQSQFGLGVVQFSRGVERLFQSLHRYGLGQGKTKRYAQGIPFLRLPTGENPKPEKYTYAAQRKLLQDFVDDLTKAEATLAKVPEGDVKLPLHVGLFSLDLNGDGKIDTEKEQLWRVYAAVSGGSVPGVNEKTATDFVIHFDSADVHWLRGYCHLLAGLTEFVLAHDFQEIFDATAHLFFAKVETPHEFLTTEDPDPEQGWFGNFGTIADGISAIHLLRMPVKEKERMLSSLKHLEAMVRESRAMWKLAMAEKDDDREWIPNPKQTSVLGVSAPAEFADGWPKLLDEMEAMLAGKKLAPFWRGKDEKRGVNIRKIFTEPRSFDLVLWIQGTAMTPYLEKGEITDRELWIGLPGRVGWPFFGYVVWFN